MKTCGPGTSWSSVFGMLRQCYPLMVRSARTEVVQGMEGLQRWAIAVVPPCYTAQVLYAWGDPISDGPAFKLDGSHTAEEQMP
jgi:hypothetical protein